MLIDSHCHLNFDAFAEDRAEVVARARAAGVIAIINPATNLADSRQIVTMAAEIPELYAAVGFHPNQAGAFDDSALAQLRELAGRPKVVAIGEIGLDYYWDEAPRPVQRRVFERQLALAREVGRPVIVHQREAAVDTMAVLRQWAAEPDRPGLVLHSFSGDLAMAVEAVELGFYIGVTGPVTFKNARELPGIVAALPPERLLVETDAPFLSPHPFRGKRNEPARVKLVAERVADLRGVALVDMSRRLTQNTISLFNLPVELMQPTNQPTNQLTNEEPMPQVAQLFSLVADEMKYVEDKMRSGIAARYEDLQAVVDYLVGAGGKRLRPALTLMAANFYPVDKDKSYSLAASVELLHTATLVHDDVIDNSLFRRGMPTLNASWSPGATILTGDYLFARSAELAAETGSVRITTIFAQTLMTIVGGELQQLFRDGRGVIPTEEEYRQRIYAKTASLFAAGTETGGVLCGAPEAEIQALRSYGYNLGMAFQIVDDILDFRGDEERIGKPVANDLRQGIATLPVMLFAQKSPNHPTIMKAVGRQPVSDAEMVAVVEQIRASGSVDAAMAEARHFARQAQAELALLPDNPYRQAMHGLAEYTVARDI